MYLCVRLSEVTVSSQESEQSCICVLCLLKCLYQARKVSGHVVRAVNTCNKPVKVSGHVVRASQESERSCICVLGLVKCLYQARKVSGHVFVC